MKSLHEPLFKLHLVQALGPLGSKLVTVPNWNTRPVASATPGRVPRPDTVLATLVPVPYFSRITELAAIIINRSKEAIRQRNERQARPRALLPLSLSLRSRGSVKCAQSAIRVESKITLSVVESY